MSQKKSFYSLETIGGMLLFIAALFAIVIANTSFRTLYHEILNLTVYIKFGEFQILKPLHAWINDGLMAIYFMLVGLEIKREVNRGILSNRASLIIPAVTALCGLAIPGIIFAAINFQNPEYLKGWAIPTATDIAFTLGIVSLLKSRVPFSLKILLTAIAIFDDIGAIVIIAVFFTHKLSMISLGLALLFTLTLIALNYFGCKRISLYMVVGTFLWAAVLQSGVHATLAGIIIAMTIPDNPSHSVLNRLENGLHPWVVFVILPVFAFANAGVTFIGLEPSQLLHPLLLGIAAGLFFGKQLGIFLPLWFFLKHDNYFKPYKTYEIGLPHLYGIACICGVGFTMSLFIGLLAFPNGSQLINLVKMGVVFGSFSSAILGCIVFLTINPKKIHSS